MVASVHSSHSKIFNFSWILKRIAKSKSVFQKDSSFKNGLRYRRDPCFRSYGGPNGSWSSSFRLFSPLAAEIFWNILID
ncbi:Protein CBG27756 [Caenorhabditis briggsae]|uniref:Protein CBG27756 n=1 Tax=Caenorhabditis briggsae TaxID=6238 RepID=B6IFY0_CAEBR|nr:Protein CBG27756 [Caenorhabditis briggsae]CAR98810.1 Protein CBG27756 [Caenorhabditis briggsae]